MSENLRDSLHIFTEQRLVGFESGHGCFLEQIYMITLVMICSCAFVGVNVGRGVDASQMTIDEEAQT